MLTNRAAHRIRADRALGRTLKPTEHVHHHSDTQLVVCTADYHRWLHGEMRRRHMPSVRVTRGQQQSYIIRDVDDALWQRVKIQAAVEGLSLKALILDALSKRVEQAQGKDRHNG